MDIALIFARILHVSLGILWVGSMFFLSTFLMPSLQEAGPDAGKVVAALTRRKFMIVLPIIALVTLLSGLYLYWRVSSGFSPEYMRSGPGQTYGLGAALAIIAFILGVSITRPAMIKATQLTQSAMNAGAGEKEAMMGEAQKLRARSASVGRIIFALLLGSTLAMSIGRYV